jgi:hypothetical protein
MCPVRDVLSLMLPGARRWYAETAQSTTVFGEPRYGRIWQVSEIARCVDCYVSNTIRILAPFVGHADEESLRPHHRNSIVVGDPPVPRDGFEVRVSSACILRADGALSGPP